MAVFGKAYSGFYDSLYGAKDYSSECDLIENLAGVQQSLLLLDMGCGTGGHAIPLAQRGHRVIGIDRSVAMLDIARQKAALAGVADRIEFIEGDVRYAETGYICNLAIMMFAVLGYQQSDIDVLQALNAVAAHLETGALFIFDIWYGPAVVAEPPGARRRVIETASGKIVRTTESRMEPDSNLCSVHFTLEHFEGARLVGTSRESHVMRYFFPNELHDFAEAAGFSCERIADFNNVERPADAASWNAMVLFRKC